MWQNPLEVCGLLNISQPNIWKSKKDMYVMWILLQKGSLSTNKPTTDSNWIDLRQIPVTFMI